MPVTAIKPIPWSPRIVLAVIVTTAIAAGVVATSAQAEPAATTASATAPSTGVTTSTITSTPPSGSPATTSPSGTVPAPFSATATYSGTDEETWDDRASGPYGALLHYFFKFSESETATFSYPSASSAWPTVVTRGPLSLSGSGNISYSVPPPLSGCSGSFSTKQGASDPFTWNPPGSFSVSAQLPEGTQQVQLSSSTGPKAIIAGYCETYGYVAGGRYGGSNYPNDAYLKLVAAGAPTCSYYATSPDQPLPPTTTTSCNRSFSVTTTKINGTDTRALDTTFTVKFSGCTCVCSLSSDAPAGQAPAATATDESALRPGLMASGRLAAGTQFDAQGSGGNCVSIEWMDSPKGPQDVTDQDSPVTVGQEVVLEARVRGKKATPADKVSWTTPGPVVSDYQVSDASAVVRPLTNKTAADVGFYWTGAGPENVGVTVNGKPAMATFVVKSPNWSFSATTCHVGIDDEGRPNFVPRGRLATPAFGPGLNNFPAPACGDEPGISWTARISGSPGQVALTQLISTKEWHNNTACLLPGSKNSYGADQHDFYRNRILSLPQPWMGNDSPATTLAYALLGGTYTQSFSAQDYLMYKPPALPGAQSIWVALAVLYWNWQATVAKDKKGQWTITNSQLNPGTHITGKEWDNPPPTWDWADSIFSFLCPP